MLHFPLQAVSAYSYLTGRKSPPKLWGTYVGVKYDEEAGRRATAEGRDLGALESQVQTAFYRPEKDPSRNNPYQTMEFRPERDGGRAELVRMNADGGSPESAGGEGAGGAGGLDGGQAWSLEGGRSQAEIQDTLNKAQGMIDGLSAPQLTTDKPYGGSGDGDGADKLMDYFPDPLAKPENGDSESPGVVGRKMLDVANRPGTAEDKAVRRLKDGVRNIGERVDWQVGMNDMQDKLDEKKVVWVGGKAYPWNEVYKGVDEVPAGNNVWEYNNKTGVLSRNGKVEYKYGYSGKGPGMNEPGMVGVRDIGPTPHGIYTIEEREIRKKMGDSWQLYETNPDFIEKIHRDPGTFYIHGDNNNGDRSASEGCLILPKKIRDKINDGDVIRIVSR